MIRLLMTFMVLSDEEVSGQRSISTRPTVAQIVPVVAELVTRDHF